MTKTERQQRERSIPSCMSCSGKVSLLQQERGSKLCRRCAEGTTENTWMRYYRINSEAEAREVEDEVRALNDTIRGLQSKISELETA